METWTAEADIIGDFFLVKEEELKPGHKPHPAILRMVLDPEFDDNNRQIGKFKLEISFELDAQQGKLPTNIPANIGRDLIDYYVDALAFLSGRPVKIAKGPTVKHQYTGTNKFRHIFPAAEQATIAPPVPLLSHNLFDLPMDSKAARVLSWYSKGLQDKDVFSSLMHFIIALEVLANQFTGSQKVVRKCQHCGQESTLEPGVKQKISYLLTEIVGFSEQQVQEIWRTRNDLVHGGFRETTSKAVDFLETKGLVAQAIMRGLTKLIRVDNLPINSPRLDPWADPLLDVEYTVPEQAAAEPST